MAETWSLAEMSGLAQRCVRSTRPGLHRGLEWYREGDYHEEIGCWMALAGFLFAAVNLNVSEAWRWAVLGL